MREDRSTTAAGHAHSRGHAISPWLPWMIGLLALAPFLIWHRSFTELFWFGDDLLLVDQIAQMGFWRWTLQFFGENFAPLYQLLWGAGLFTFDGSYTSMLWLLWLTHALNTAVLGALLLRAGFPWIAAVFTQLVFALTPATIETLGWSVQWSPMLAVTFLLLGLLWHEKYASHAVIWSWRAHGPLVLFAAASASCFARGVLTGGLLALALAMPAAAARDLPALRRRLPAALLCLLPAIAVAAIIIMFSGSATRNIAGHWSEVLQFSLTFLLTNPAHRLFDQPHLSWELSLLLLGGLKLAIIISAFRHSPARVRRLLVLFLVYDIGNAVLLGIGRFHTGPPAAVSSRYYYSSLLATLPFAGLVLARLMEKVPLRAHARRATAAVLLAAIGLHFLVRWPSALRPFVAWRGTELRQLMAAPYTTAPDATVPALDHMHIERAKALQRAFNLH